MNTSNSADPVRLHLALLGLRMRDRVTGYVGVVTSVAFDLYGCVVATVHSGLDEKGAPADQHWFDVKRLEHTGSEVLGVGGPTRVMDAPAFLDAPGVEAGPSDKPRVGHV